MSKNIFSKFQYPLESLLNLNQLIIFIKKMQRICSSILKLSDPVSLALKSGKAVVAL